MNGGKIKLKKYKEIVEDKRILVTGGTGSLGSNLVRQLLTGKMGRPKKIIVFSRDENKQQSMRLEYKRQSVFTDDIIYRNAQDILTFRIGDIRNFPSVERAVKEADIVFHTAAMKQVPTCEYFPFEAVKTNTVGASNLVRAVQENGNSVDTVVGISTDKACKPINVMGMTKALQERILVQANLGSHQTRFICVRYGNVIGSRGSVLPLFVEQIKKGGPVTITLKEMTRFIIDLDSAVKTIFFAIDNAAPGEIVIPKIPSARILDMASVLSGSQKIPIVYTGIRPGEKVHEILISEEERHRTIEKENYFIILPVLPELRSRSIDKPVVSKEYSSRDHLMNKEELRLCLNKAGFDV